MPGGTVCSVATCKNNSKTIKATKRHVMFFTFPKNTIIRDEWMKKCCRKNEFNPQYKRLCSEHFLLEDYEDKMQAKLMSLQPKKLKSTAIPSQNLPHMPTLIASQVSEGSKRYLKKEITGVVSTSIRVASELEIESVTPVEMKTSTLQNTMKAGPVSNVEIEASPTNKLQYDKLTINYHILSKENEQLKTEIKTHEATIKNLKQNVLELKEQLKTECMNFKDEYNNSRRIVNRTSQNLRTKMNIQYYINLYINKEYSLA